MPPCDVFIFAGDMSHFGRFNEILSFANWLKTVPAKHKLIIAGNHDLSFDCKQPEYSWDSEDILRQVPGCVYLQDAACIIEDVKFYGSPYQPSFGDWAFNIPRNSPELADRWNRIPLDTDVLITHGPPKGILDLDRKLESAGCECLARKLPSLRQLKLHCFGHLHSGYGAAKIGEVVFVNGSACNEAYQPVNKPIYLEI